MIKLTNWPRITKEDPANPGQGIEVDGDRVDVYINPEHIVVLEPTKGGTLVALLGQGVLRVSEDMETVLLKMQGEIE